MSDERLGQAGEEGSPGEPGTGGGGAGGRGANLATGWKRWRGLVGYIGIVLVSVVAIELHHNETTNGIKQTSREACARSMLLADNQAFVLRTLRLLLLEESREEGIADHPELDERLNTILARLNQVPRFECDKK